MSSPSAVQRDITDVTHLPRLDVADVTHLPGLGVADVTHLPRLDVADVTHLPRLDVADVTHLPDLDYVLADGDRGPALDTLGWPVVAGCTDRGPWREPGGGGRAPGRAAGDARQSPAANGSWVHQHLRTVAQPLDAAPANTRIHSLPGTAPLSIGLEPHPDRPGNQQVKEITP